MNTVELKQLKYFMHVAELGSYTRAAEVIDVAQPVLSRQIRQLEIELRQNLLIRHGRGVVLTDSGRTLLKHVNIIMDQIDEAYEDLSLSDGKLAGHITIGLPPTVAKLIAIDLVRAFKQRLPLAHLTIEEGLTVHIEENLGLGRMDIGLLNNPTFSPNIDTKELKKGQTVRLNEALTVVEAGHYESVGEISTLREILSGAAGGKAAYRAALRENERALRAERRVREQQLVQRRGVERGVPRRNARAVPKAQDLRRVRAVIQAKLHNPSIQA